MNKVEINGIYYYLSECEKTAEVTENPNKYSGAVSIPETVIYNGITYSVKSIGNRAFWVCKGLTSVYIPYSVKSIGDWAFTDCNGLASINVETGNTIYDSRNNCNAIIETETNTLVAGCKNTTIPDSITSIGNYAFYKCSRLTSVNIPYSVKRIGDWAFDGCSGLTSINVETGNTIYDSRNNCNAIIETETNTLVAGCKNTNIPDSVTSIGLSAFSGCCGLRSINIPNSVTRIGGAAFNGCSGLTSVNIPDSVTSIGRSAFSGCSGLTSINVETGNTTYDSRNNCNAIIETATNTLISGCRHTNIPNSVKSIGNSAFAMCYRLTSVYIPNSVTSIGNHAFSSCRGLTSIHIPNSVTSIGGAAFNGCSGLTSVNIPDSVTSIGRSAFANCSGLTSINVETGNITYDSRNNCNAIIETATNTLVAGYKNTNIPDSVTSIGLSAFFGCSGLTSVNIPNSVTSIGLSAFWGCTGLTSIYIPDSVTTIGGFAFSGCIGLTSIYIPNSVKSIEFVAFSRCEGLADVYCYAEKVPSTQSSAFDDSYTEYATLHVPAASIEQYKTTEPWSDFGTIVAIDETETQAS